MQKSFRSLIMFVSLLALVVCGAVMPRPLQASDDKGEEAAIHVQWTATEPELQDLLAELKGMDVQMGKGGKQATDLPVTASWTSKEMSAQALATWITNQPALNRPGCFNITVTGQIWHPIFRDWIRVEFTIRVCPELD